MRRSGVIGCGACCFSGSFAVFGSGSRIALAFCEQLKGIHNDIAGIVQTADIQTEIHLEECRVFKLCRRIFQLAFILPRLRAPAGIPIIMLAQYIFLYQPAFKIHGNDYGGIRPAIGKLCINNSTVFFHKHGVKTCAQRKGTVLTQLQEQSRNTKHIGAGFVSYIEGKAGCLAPCLAHFFPFGFIQRCADALKLGSENDIGAVLKVAVIIRDKLKTLGAVFAIVSDFHGAVGKIVRIHIVLVEGLGNGRIFLADHGVVGILEILAHVIFFGLIADRCCQRR